MTCEARSPVRGVPHALKNLNGVCHKMTNPISLNSRAIVYSEASFAMGYKILGGNSEAFRVELGSVASHSGLRISEDQEGKIAFLRILRCATHDFCKNAKLQKRYRKNQELLYHHSPPLPARGGGVAVYNAVLTCKARSPFRGVAPPVTSKNFAWGDVRST